VREVTPSPRNEKGPVSGVELLIRVTTGLMYTPTCALALAATAASTTAARTYRNLIKNNPYLRLSF
jgi:hypothetical protein